MECVANTFIFMIMGVIIAGQIHVAHRSATPLQPRDYGFAVMLWTLLLARNCWSLAPCAALNCH